MKKICITFYNCERDEIETFNELPPRFGIIPAITRSAVSEANAVLAAGNHCISVGHKSEITKPTLYALKKAGVRYISTRSVDCNHIDMAAAKSMEIAVGNTAYSPAGVANYTLMLMLIAIRNSKSGMTGYRQIVEMKQGAFLMMQSGADLWMDFERSLIYE